MSTGTACVICRQRVIENAEAERPLMITEPTTNATLHQLSAALSEAGTCGVSTRAQSHVQSGSSMDTYRFEKQMGILLSPRGTDGSCSTVELSSSGSTVWKGMTAALQETS